MKYFIAGIALLLASTGCGPDCSEEAVASVHVVVTDGARDVPINDAKVTYTLDGSAEKGCDSFGEGNYVCGWDESGSFGITVSKLLYSEVSESVTVEALSCHVATQDLPVTLQPDQS